MLEPGRHSPKKKTFGKNFLQFFGFLILLSVIVSVFGALYKPPTKSAEQLKREAAHGERPDDSSYELSVEKYLKSVAKDPDSVKIYGYPDSGYSEKHGWVKSVDWGAKNGFGGMDRETWWFAISNGKIRYLPGADFRKK